MADHILILGSHEAHLHALRSALLEDGMEVTAVPVSTQPLPLIQQFDLILLDGDTSNGSEVIEAIRGYGIQTPIILLSSRESRCHLIAALETGADDYVAKPFEPSILRAKVKALIRRSRICLSGNGEIIAIGPFRYHTSTLRFFKNNREILLSSKENAMMKLFLDNPGWTFSKDMLYDLIWGDTIIDENAIMVYISRLRQKIEDDPSHPQYIQTIRGFGYRFSL